MKKISIALILLLLACSAAPLFAQDEESEGEDNTDLDSLEAALNPARPMPAAAARPETASTANLAEWEQWWQRSLRYQRQDSLEQALACADSVVEKANILDLRLPVLSSYWLFRSRQALKTGDPPGRTLARRYSSLALSINPASLPAI
ncbi:MAG: hypothetical protein QME74_11980, partial [Candidatus Edwardsbacteria bacterium]|nr:hypothetical protein [Candidatus Edwardsbacteria bacterium]